MIVVMCSYIGGTVVQCVVFSPGFGLQLVWSVCATFSPRSHTGSPSGSPVQIKKSMPVDG